jgi:formylglycine-generating enzyme required for sulfatase activity
MSLPSQPSDPLRHVLAWPERGVEMAFRLIPAGAFRMGSRGNYPAEEPGHQVRIAQPFWLAETPVTQAQFALWTEAEGIEHGNHFKGHPDRPAQNVDWRQAAGYCCWLTGVQAGKLPKTPHDDWFACLPTEAEWEYACRAGSETDYFNGDGEAALVEVGWYNGNSGGETHAVDEPVGGRVEVGLRGLHGNVWEWCHDGWDAAAYRRQVEGDEDQWHRARASDNASRREEMLQHSRHRVLRGGSWIDAAGLCRSASRLGWPPADRYRYFGFRVCMAPRSGGNPRQPRVLCLADS